MKQKQFWRTA